MSDETGQATESATEGSVLDLLEDWYHVPVLAALLAFMLWVRTQATEKFLRNGRVYFSGNDPWYHLRQVTYTVQNWPRVMPFDPWTNFPKGTSVGQFGTLFDQLVATAALVVGLGDPSQHTVRLTLLLAPAVFGTLAVLPTYYIGKRLGGRVGGVFGVLVLALLPGTFLTRSLVGVADHNAAEPLFQALAVAAILVALAVAERERPVWEQFVDRDVAGLRRVVGWSAVAGVAGGLYIWVWPPGVLLFGILGTFFVLSLTASFLRGTSPEHVGVVGVVAMGVAAVVSLVPLDTLSFTPTQFSLLQPGMALAVAVGAGFMSWLAREWERRDYARSLYPLAVFGVMVVGIAAVWLVRPGVVDLIRINLLRFVGFQSGAAQRTIGEAQPLLARSDYFPAVFQQYGLAFFAALAGAVVMLYRSLVREELRAERTLVLVWFAFVTAAAFTQLRFNYYLAVPVAGLNAYLLSWVLDLPGRVGAVEDVSATHVVAVVVVAMLVVAPLAVGVNQGQRGQSVRLDSAGFVGQYGSSPRQFIGWQDSISWLRNNTPAEGDYGGAGNAGKLDYDGTYHQVDDFDMPAGSYGVMSWWDYGHWLTVGAHRIPVANPFQQGATVAANYLLAGDEATAREVLRQREEDDAKVRYVAVDYQMVTPGSKFAAPTVFYDRGEVRPGDFVKLYYQRTQRGFQPRFYMKTQRYYESMMVRLYRYHGSRVEPQAVVVDWQRNATTRGGRQVVVGEGNATTRFPNMTAAREYVRQDPTSQIGGVGGLPSRVVPALEHYRLVQASNNSAPFITARREGYTMPAYVKLFERVHGAEIQGTGPENATVTASVTMRVPTRDTNFTYTQQARTGPDGEFNMTLPYSTTGYENWGTEEGYTNVSVRAEGPYQFSTGLFADENALVTYSASVNVSEARVLGEDGSPRRVTLERTTVMGGNQTGDSNNSTADSGGSSGSGGSGGGSAALTAPRRALARPVA